MELNASHDGRRTRTLPRYDSVMNGVAVEKSAIARLYVVFEFTGLLSYDLSQLDVSCLYSMTERLDDGLQKIVTGHSGCGSNGNQHAMYAIGVRFRPSGDTSQ